MDEGEPHPRLAASARKVPAFEVMHDNVPLRRSLAEENLARGLPETVVGQGLFRKAEQAREKQVNQIEEE